MKGREGRRLPFLFSKAPLKYNNNVQSGWCPECSGHHQMPAFRHIRKSRIFWHAFEIFNRFRYQKIKHLRVDQREFLHWLNLLVWVPQLLWIIHLFPQINFAEINEVRTNYKAVVVIIRPLRCK